MVRLAGCHSRWSKGGLVGSLYFVLLDSTAMPSHCLLYLGEASQKNDKIRPTTLDGVRFEPPPVGLLPPFLIGFVTTKSIPSSVEIGARSRRSESPQEFVPSLQSRYFEGELIREQLEI